MTLQGVDASHALSGAAVAADGYAFVARYLSSVPGPKVVTAAEIADLHAHGIAVLLVYEDGQSSTSPDQARAAVIQARSLGVPTDNTVAVCMADDENPSGPNVLTDMEASSAVLRGAGLLAGFYGAKSTARALQGGGHIDVAWVVDTWGADDPGDRWNVRQLPNAGQVVVGGVTCDLDDAPYPVGLWAPAPVPPPAPPAPPTVTPTGDPTVGKEIILSIGVAPDPDGHGSAGWAVIGEFVDSIVGVDIGGEDPAVSGKYPHFLAPTWEAVAVGATKIQIETEDTFTGPVTVRVFCTA